MEHKTLELLESLGVITLARVRAHVGSLSGGQRQSVAIARSLLGEPRVAILDEPTAALGVVQTGQVLQLIGRLRGRGLAVVVISHNLEEIYHVADRIVVLRLGRTAASFDRRTTLGKASSPRSRAPRHRPDRGVRDPGDPLPAVPNGRKAVDAGAMRAHTIGQRLAA
jgi:D-xylose transport system ATP-binding protein